jgi:mannosyltransferase OCH1-like enzyme
MIPKNLYILHSQLRETSIISKEWSKLHPDYKIQICDYDMAKNMLRSMPEIYYKTFMKINTHRIRADFLKLVLLYEYGGTIVDCDLEPLCALDTFVENDVVLCKSIYENTCTGFCGKFMASVKQNGFIKQLLYIYINHFLVEGSWFPDTGELSYIIDNMSVIPNYIQMIQQKGAHFFYDMCYTYGNKRIMNDRAIYFETSCF